MECCCGARSGKEEEDSGLRVPIVLQRDQEHGYDGDGGCTPTPVQVSMHARAQAEPASDESHAPVVQRPQVLEATFIEPARDEPHAPVLQRPQCRFGDRCSRANPEHFAAECHPGDPDAEPYTARCRPCIQPGPALEPREGVFDWIRHANTEDDRAQRRAVALQTLTVCRAAGYDFSDTRPAVKLSSVDALVEGTRLLTGKQVVYELSQMPSPPPNQMPFLTAVPEQNALEVLLSRQWGSERVVLLSAASAYHPCGGFRSGGRHAFEEALCVQSTLSLSLQRAFLLSRQPPHPVACPARVRERSRKEWLCYIPDDGVVLSPGVEVFREGSGEGYTFLPQAIKLAAVVSVAMPNRNESVRDSPVDAPEDMSDYRALVQAKLSSAFGAAQLAGADVVIFPGLGCGVFRNDPQEIGQALGAVLLGSHGIKEIIIAADRNTKTIKTAAEQVAGLSSN